MIEDKLTQNQRIRLEAIAQTNVSFGMRANTTWKEFEDRYNAFVKLISGPSEDGEFLNDNTLNVVFSVLTTHVMPDLARTILNDLQNAGILFRERSVAG